MNETLITTQDDTLKILDNLFKDERDRWNSFFNKLNSIKHWFIFLVDLLVFKIFKAIIITTKSIFFGKI